MKANVAIFLALVSLGLSGYMAYRILKFKKSIETVFSPVSGADIGSAITGLFTSSDDETVAEEPVEEAS